MTIKLDKNSKPALVQFQAKVKGATQKSIADELGVSTSAVSRAITEFETDDFNLQVLRLKIINLINNKKSKAA